MADFQKDVLQSMPLITINRHLFFLLDALKKYIDNLAYRKQLFSVEQQGLEFYVTYADTIVENRSAFKKKIKDRGFWKAVGYSKKDMDELTKTI